MPQTSLASGELLTIREIASASDLSEHTLRCYENTASASASTSPWLITPSAEPGAPSTLRSSSTCRWVDDPTSRIAPKSTLLS